MLETNKELNLLGEEPAKSAAKGDDGGGDLPLVLEPFNPDKNREETRGDLARGLLWLLTFVVGGVLAFIGLGRLEGAVLTQSIFPSLIALAGTALGFYFGSQSGSGVQSGAKMPFLPVGSPPPALNLVVPQSKVDQPPLVVPTHVETGRPEEQTQGKPGE